MAGVAAVENRVRRFLEAEGNSTEQNPSGSFVYRAGTSLIRIAVQPVDHRNTVVVFESPVLLDLQESPELFEYVALANYAFQMGHLELQEDGEGGWALLYRVTLLGNSLDRPELVSAVYAVTSAADGLDEELQERFGGRRAIEVFGDS